MLLIFFVHVESNYFSYNCIRTEYTVSLFVDISRCERMHDLLKMTSYKIIDFNFIEQYQNSLSGKKIDPILRIRIIKTENGSTKTIICRNIQHLPLVFFVSGHGKFPDNELINKIDDINSFDARIKSEKSIFQQKIIINCDRVVKELETLFPQLIIQVGHTGLLVETISRTIEESIKNKRFHSRDYGCIVVLRLKPKRPESEQINKVK